MLLLILHFIVFDLNLYQFFISNFLITTESKVFLILISFSIAEFGFIYKALNL